ncbi:hypothetical protein AX16_007839 [Volvariella volvacea WC 439]|nr:hypothetical protein AX16_007839 [Volvariella volvacea WC 439]
MASFTRAGKKPYSRPAPRVGTDGQWLHDKAPGSKPSGAPAKPKAAPSGPPGITAKILITNLHYEVTPKDLTSIFGQIGTLVREPLIRYDNSGRSTGEAIVTFESPAEATRAKNQFEGILAKGQPMSITYYTPPPRTRRSNSAPSSLLQRIQKTPLLDRLSGEDANVKPSNERTTGPGPVRTKQARSQRFKAGQKKAPKTAEELDKELDAFMGDSMPASNLTPATLVQAKEPEVATTQDVEMA